MERKCASKAYAVWTGISFAVIALSLGICVLVYRHRWDIRFIALKVIRQRKVHLDKEDTKVYEYDAFVAFDQEDYKWVSEELMQNLEQPEGHSEEQGRYFKLCIHNRDWEYGTRITENIVESVLNSRKTILVLTPSFVQSYWCDYELQMARMRCFEEGRDIIIVIMLQPVDAASMNHTLRTLIKTVTYLEWRTHDIDRKVFWEKLKRSLNKKDTKAPVCECGRKEYKD